LSSFGFKEFLGPRFRGDDREARGNDRRERLDDRDLKGGDVGSNGHDMRAGVRPSLSTRTELVSFNLDLYHPDSNSR